MVAHSYNPSPQMLRQEDCHELKRQLRQTHQQGCIYLQETSTLKLTHSLELETQTPPLPMELKRKQNATEVNSSRERIKEGIGWVTEQHGSWCP